MRVCLIGIGSIARRHIANLREIAVEQGFDLQIDAVRRPDSQGTPDGVDHVFLSAAGLPDGYDAIFITNPTEYHLSALEAVGEKSNCFFIEKPLTSVRRLTEVKKLRLRREAVYYVACPLRYTGVIQYLKKYVAGHRVIGVRAISSSYLPEWRPGTDYRDSYSARRDLGGGVSMDLIHEWDYLKFLFGKPRDVIYRCGKKSDLEIDCEDTALYIAEYEDKFVELHLDYYGRKSIREIMLFTPDETLLCDLIHSEISFMKSGRTIRFAETRDDFQKKELSHFFSFLKSGISDHTIADAYETMLLTQGILENMER